MYRTSLSLRCDPEQYSIVLCYPAMCNHSCIRQELACYTWQHRMAGRRPLGGGSQKEQRIVICPVKDIFKNDISDGTT